MVRVIAGTARGHRLNTPKSAARPTPERVREALFSILHPYLKGVRFADLYAGSGANGIEALSREAAYCIFVDSDSQAMHTIGSNLFHTKLEHKSKSYQLTLPLALGLLAKDEEPFDIVFCDPPFALADYSVLLSQIIQNKLVTNGGMVIVEHDSHIKLPHSVEQLTVFRESNYGRIGLTFFT